MKKKGDACSTGGTLDFEEGGEFSDVEKRIMP